MRYQELYEDDNYSEKEYMEEGCAYLAIAISRMTGLPIKILIDGGDMWDEDTPSVAHVFVASGDKAIDAKGRRPIQSIVKEYHDLQDPRVIDVTASELIEDFMGDDKPLFGYSEDEIVAATKYAKNNIGVIEKYTKKIDRHFDEQQAINNATMQGATVEKALADEEMAAKQEALYGSFEQKNKN